MQTYNTGLGKPTVLNVADKSDAITPPGALRRVGPMPPEMMRPPR